MLLTKKRNISDNNNQWKAYIWLAIPIISVMIFCVYPAFAAIFRSFMDWSPSSSSWKHFGNYIELFKDNLFWSAFKNMLILTLFSILTGNVMTLLLAELLFKLKFSKISKIYRYLFLLPALVPGMVTVLLWKNVILSGASEGLLNSILIKLGCEPKGWYFDKAKVLLSIILTNFPWVGGVSFLIYLSGLQAIPESIYEACELEGISAIKKVWYIDLPLLVSQIKYFIIIGVINGVQVYDIQLILGLSPIDVSSTVPGYLLYYYTFSSPKYGYAASIGVVLFIITLLISTISNKISDKLKVEN